MPPGDGLEEVALTREEALEINYLKRSNSYAAAALETRILEQKQAALEHSKELEQKARKKREAAEQRVREKQERAAQAEYEKELKREEARLAKDPNSPLRQVDGALEPIALILESKKYDPSVRIPVAADLLEKLFTILETYPPDSQEWQTELLLLEQKGWQTYSSQKALKHRFKLKRKVTVAEYKEQIANLSPEIRDSIRKLFNDFFVERVHQIHVVLNQAYGGIFFTAGMGIGTGTMTTGLGKTYRTFHPMFPIGFGLGANADVTYFDGTIQGTHLEDVKKYDESATPSRHESPGHVEVCFVNFCFNPQYKNVNGEKSRGRYFTLGFGTTDSLPPATYKIFSKSKRDYSFFRKRLGIKVQETPVS